MLCLPDATKEINKFLEIKQLPEKIVYAPLKYLWGKWDGAFAFTNYRNGEVIYYDPIQGLPVGGWAEPKDFWIEISNKKNHHIDGELLEQFYFTILAHELIHIKQVERIGDVRKFMTIYCKCRSQWIDNPAEDEAYKVSCELANRTYDTDYWNPDRVRWAVDGAYSYSDRSLLQ